MQRPLSSFWDAEAQLREDQVFGKLFEAQYFDSMTYYVVEVIDKLPSGQHCWQSDSLRNSSKNFLKIVKASIFYFFAILDFLLRANPGQVCKILFHWQNGFITIRWSSCKIWIQKKSNHELCKTKKPGVERNYKNGSKLLQVKKKRNVTCKTDGEATNLTKVS